MRILSLGLSALVVILLFVAGHGTTTSVNAVSGVRELTSQEMDCIVGGDASCFDVAGTIFDECANQVAIDPENPHATLGELGGCAVRSGWGFVICGLMWLWHLVF